LSSQSQVFSGLDESKADKLTLEPILGCFHGLGESQRCSPYPELFSQPDDSKRAQKMLELALSQVFSGLNENPTNLVPMLDKTHK
jgi:hypothetical protein